MVFGHTTEQEITEGNRRILRITAASEDELRKSVQKIKDRRNLDLDVAAFVEAATVRSRYIDEPTCSWTAIGDPTITNRW